MGARHRVAAAATSCIALAAAAGAHASVPCPGDTDVPAAASRDVALALLCDINAMRAHDGLRPLRWNSRLWAGAQGMATEISRKRFFAHVTPDGRSLAARIEPTGYLPDSPTWLLAENLAWGQGALSTPLAVALGWMNSPGHRRNVMDPQLRDIGIGMAAATLSLGSGMAYVADFGTRATASRAKGARHRSSGDATPARTRRTGAPPGTPSPPSRLRDAPAPQPPPADRPAGAPHPSPPQSRRPG